jgi:hypothetical protein
VARPATSIPIASTVRRWRPGPQTPREEAARSRCPPA